MLAMLDALVVVATEGGIPGSDWRAKIAVPIGLLLFIGSVYLLVRANLGSRRGYLVMATSLFGFMVIYAAFWTFGAPGTPPATGPQNLPGQQLDAYEPVWRPFAGDSNIANQAEYQIVKSFPEGFAETPEAAGLSADFAEAAETGIGDILSFFSGPQLDPLPIAETWVPVQTGYAVATNGYPMIGVTYQETYQLGPEGEEPEGPIGEPIPDGETYTAFGFFDPGAPAFPSLLTLGIMVLLFVVHALLLARDEARERRELLQERQTPAAEPTAVGAVRAP